MRDKIPELMVCELKEFQSIAEPVDHMAYNNTKSTHQGQFFKYIVC